MKKTIKNHFRSFVLLGVVIAATACQTVNYKSHKSPLVRTNLTELNKLAGEIGRTRSTRYISPFSISYQFDFKDCTLIYDRIVAHARGAVYITWYIPLKSVRFKVYQSRFNNYTRSGFRCLDSKDSCIEMKSTGRGRRQQYMYFRNISFQQGLKLQKEIEPLIHYCKALNQPKNIKDSNTKK